MGTRRVTREGSSSSSDGAAALQHQTRAPVASGSRSVRELPSLDSCSQKPLSPKKSLSQVKGHGLRISYGPEPIQARESDGVLALVGGAGSTLPTCLCFHHGPQVGVSVRKGLFLLEEGDILQKIQCPTKKYTFLCRQRLAPQHVQGADHPLTEGSPRKCLRSEEDRSEL